VIRSISGFHSDGHDGWVAELSCFHHQLVRHISPHHPRPWEPEPEGRAGGVGSPIDCRLCERAELPDGLAVVGHAGPWDQDSLPDGLRGAHRTPGGRWGRLHILEGKIDFQFESDVNPKPRLHLHAGAAQSIPPGVAHRVVPTGPVRLQLEFLSREP